MTTRNDTGGGLIELAPGYRIERIVAGSEFHTASGVAFGPDGRLYAASVGGKHLRPGHLHGCGVGRGRTVRGRGRRPPVHARRQPDRDGLSRWDGAPTQCGRQQGRPRHRAARHQLGRAARDGARLFAGQVFMGDGLWEIDLAGSEPPRLVADGTGGLNAFHFGPDGTIYAPSWDRGQVVRRTRGAKEPPDRPDLLPG